MLRFTLSESSDEEIAPHIVGFAYGQQLLSWEGDFPSVFVFVYAMGEGQSHIYIKKITGARDLGDPLIEVSYFDGTTQVVTTGYQFYISKKEAEL